MKALLLALSLLFVVACNQQEKKNSNTTVTQKTTLHEIIESEVELPTDENNLIKSFQGNYFSLKQGENNFIYKEDCNFIDKNLSFSKKLDDVNFWELYYYGETFDIQQVTKENNTIQIKAYSDKVVTFFITPNENKMVWDIACNTTDYTTPFCLTSDTRKFKTVPCEAIHKIIDGLPTTWYELSNQDGKDVIFEPCEDAPSGITMDGETIDFWSGSDPYPIVSMSKLFNQVTIIYETRISPENKLIMTYQSKSLVQFGLGIDSDNIFVSNESKANYPIITESCE